MSHIPVALRRAAIDRANGRCEYCQLAQVSQEATFHIDHVVPVTAGGGTRFENLALACVSCSLRKGARQTAHDPTTGQEATLFHPCAQRWEDHFRWDGVTVVGTTATGRATVACLHLNRPLILAIRQEESRAGRHPPLV